MAKSNLKQKGSSSRGGTYASNKIKDPTSVPAAGQEVIDFGIRQFYKPEDDEKDMIRYIYNRYEQMRTGKERIEAEKIWEKSAKQWESYREPRGPDDWQSNHYVPLTFSIIESALAEVIDQSPQPLIIPRAPEDTPRATVMQHIMEYTWDVAEGDVQLYNILKGCLINGTAIAQEYYFRDPRKIVGDDGKEKDEFAYDDCYLEPVKLESFFVDETARSFTGPYAARDCVRRYIMDIDAFKQFFKGNTWDPLGNAKYVVPGGNVQYYEWYKPPDGIDHRRQVEVLWYWAIKPRDWLCVVANDVMVVMGPNPYEHKELPFVRFNDVARPNMFWGKGEAEILESIQDELNTIRRMNIDRNHLDIDKMFFVSSRLNLTDEDTIARPHGMIPVDDINGAKPIEYGDIPRSVELSLEHLEDDSTISTGINPRAQSMPENVTATQAAIAKESALKRIRLKMKMWERESLARIGELRVSNILQFYPQTKMEKIIGSEQTNDFENSTSQLMAQGFLDSTENTKQSYSKIPIKGKEINFDENGNMQESSTNGITFFELRPEYYRPISRGGYIIRYEAGSTLPISKPLMQSKTAEMYDRLIQIALGVPNTYDPLKLGDALLKVNDFNPTEFHTDNQNQNSAMDARMQKLIDMAVQENKLMMSGKNVPSTPFANQAHTQIHNEFMASPQFQALKKDNPIVKIFTDHVVGEIAAENQRAGLGNPPQNQNAMNNQPQGQQPQVSQGPQGPQGGNLPPRPQTMQSNQGPTANMGGNPMMTNMMPNLIQGGAQVPPS
jgi:hypothetical protein